MEVPQSSNSLGYQNLKKNFGEWVVEWINNKTSEKQLSLDLLDVVQLLQAVGFTVHNMEAPRPQSTDVSDKQEVRVTVACTNSNQECVLEQPLNKENCNCLKNPDIADDTLRKTIKPMFADPRPVTGYFNDLNFIPVVPNHLKQVVAEIMKHLIHMLRESNASSTIAHRKYKNLNDIIKKLESFRIVTDIDFSSTTETEVENIAIKNGASSNTVSKNQPASANGIGVATESEESPPPGDYVVVCDSVNNGASRNTQKADGDPIYKTDSQSVVEADLKEALDI